MKTKSILILILVFMTGLAAFSQNYLILARPVDSKDWGYANLKGEFVIQPQYRNCIGFSEEGLAAVYDAKQKQFFFLKPNGEKLQTEITDFKLIEIFGFGMKGFSDGFAPVKYQDKWGYLNTEGKLAVQATFDKVTPFSGGYAAGQKGGKFYVIDKNGTETLVDATGITDVNDFSEGLASFKSSGGLIGFLDGSGKVAIPAQFSSAGDFHGGLAWAKNNSGAIGYLNPKGEWIIPPQFEAGKDYDVETGLARVKNGDNWAYVNMEGELIMPPETDIYEDFFNGLARGKKNDKFGFYDAKGNWAIPPQFDGARDFKNGYASVKKGEKWGVIDKAGNWVIEPSFDEIKDVAIIR